MNRDDVELHVVARSEDLEAMGRASDRLHHHPAPSWTRHPPLRLLWEQTLLPRLAARLDVDVIHAPHYTMPILARRPVVVTVHDATFFTRPEAHSTLKAVFFRAWSRFSARHAALLIAPSDATRQEFLRVTGTTRPIVVAHHGVSATTFHPPTDEAVATFRRDHGLGDHPWVAFLGTIEPRKNVPALIRALGRLDSYPPLTLLVAGAQGWDETVDVAIAESGVADRVRLLGYLPTAELAALLGGAACVAYPSEEEGFGLPVLEAMACGAAVITTPRSALAEIGADTVEYSETDPGSLAAAIQRVLTGTRRAELSRAARRRASSFTWEACATQHHVAYRSAAAGAA